MSDGCQRQQARAVADRGRGRPREVDRPHHRGHRDGGCHRQGGAFALRRGNRRPRRDQSQDRRAAAVAPSAGGGRRREHVQPDQRRGGQERQSRRPGRRHHFRCAAAAGIRPHCRAIGQAGDRAEGARGRARSAVPGIQGPHRRYRQRHRQARRIRQRGGGPRPRRGDHPPRRDAAARNAAQRRPRPRLYLRRAPRTARSADFPVAHAPAVHGQAVRPGGAGNLRRHRRGQGGRARSRLTRQDRGDLA